MHHLSHDVRVLFSVRSSTSLFVEDTLAKFTEHHMLFFSDLLDVREEGSPQQFSDPCPLIWEETATDQY